MTREEALEELKEIRFNLNYKVNGTSRFDEALDMAIKALKQQPSEDCVSRQAAIDAIGNVPDYDDGMIFEALSHAQRNVALLPPVTPQIKIENAPLSMIKSIREKENE